MADSQGGKRDSGQQPVLTTTKEHSISSPVEEPSSSAAAPSAVSGPGVAEGRGYGPYIQITLSGTGVVGKGI